MFEKLKQAFTKFGKKAEKEASKPEKKEEKKGFLSTLGQSKLSDSKFEELFNEFETELLQNNIAYDVVEKIKEELKSACVGKSFKKKELENKIKEELKSLISNILKQTKPINLLKLKKPGIILFVGTNGHGKTTNLAKLAYLLKKKNKKCVFAASDTFRAAAIEQLEHHANKLKIKMIKHAYGADPAAVAYDAVEHAKAKGLDFVLIDTAGRSHANADLMEEMKKIKRVVNPDLIIFVSESIVGNDAVEQANSFNEAIGIDGVILTKTDVDEKGGAIISIVSEIKKPIMFLGVGQNYKDLEEFDYKKIVGKLF